MQAYARIVSFLWICVLLFALVLIVAGTPELFAIWFFFLLGVGLVSPLG